MRSRVLGGIALAAMLVVGLTAAGCGSSSAGAKSAAKLMPELQAAARSATSVHMAGLVKSGGQTVTINMSFDGDSVAGTLQLNGASFELLSLKGKTYIKLNASFLKLAKAPAIACATICGRYVELPAASARQITGSLSMQQLVNQVFSDKNTRQGAASGCTFSPATVNGQSVLQCSYRGNTVDVAAHGKPYPVYFTGPHGQHIAFSEWNSATLPPVPPANLVISLSKLS
ncbi:MAG TPA: hypothetical protein VGI66_15925 [Streptosporangiaceae bacterium]